MDHLGSGRSFDRLPLPEWRRAFLARHGQVPKGTADAPETVAGLQALRVLLRPLLETFARGEALAAADIDALNHVLAASPRVRRLETVGGEYRLVEAPASRDRRWALAEVAASAAELLAGGEPARLRVCANPACSWMFYDETRNGSRRWCEGAICGNLLKVRRFRARADRG
jgi:predicted RNA-binding Zn ribbon-like protein